MINTLKRKDGTLSRTKTLNAAGLILALVGAILPVAQIYVAPEIYSAAIAVFAIINNHLRNSQTRL